MNELQELYRLFWQLVTKHENDPGFVAAFFSATPVDGEYDEDSVSSVVGYLCPQVGIYDRHTRTCKWDRFTNCGKIALLSALLAQAPPLKADGSPKKKTVNGKRKKAEAKIMIVKEYREGLDSGHWTGQSDYLRLKHSIRWERNANSARSWLSTLIKEFSDQATD